MTGHRSVRPRHDCRGLTLGALAWLRFVGGRNGRCRGFSLFDNIPGSTQGAYQTDTEGEGGGEGETVMQEYDTQEHGPYLDDLECRMRRRMVDWLKTKIAHSKR